MMNENEPSEAYDDDLSIEVDIIVPVHNSAATLSSTLASAVHQQVGTDCCCNIQIYVCCYDDGSTDDSWDILQEIQRKHLTTHQQTSSSSSNSPLATIESHVLVKPGSHSRGAGYARNQAVRLRPMRPEHQYLCLLDSDDLMSSHRVWTQLQYFLRLLPSQRHSTLVGSQFDRDPPTATEHYTEWANSLSPERLVLERFREVTLVQPTWMMTRTRFEQLGGYLEAPTTGRAMEAMMMTTMQPQLQQTATTTSFRLIHSQETLETLRVAEDLRFFHAHMAADGLLHQVPQKLVTYRYTHGQGQSFQTSRKLLLQLRARALECNVSASPQWRQACDGKFVVWGAGRDGKDFIKALQPETRRRVYCLADVDPHKIAARYYVYGDRKIPIVHVSYLVRDDQRRSAMIQAWNDGTEEGGMCFGKIQKNRAVPTKKKLKMSSSLVELDPCIDPALLPHLPVVVCVAMYRTNGALEANVASIGRTEGNDLWHFS